MIFFCHFSKGYSAIPTPGNLNIEIIRGLQGVTKPNARDEFQHMPPVFSFCVLIGRRRLHWQRTQMWRASG